MVLADGQLVPIMACFDGWIQEEKLQCSRRRQGDKTYPHTAELH